MRNQGREREAHVPGSDVRCSCGIGLPAFAPGAYATGTVILPSPKESTIREQVSREQNRRA
jgi:hypothetical protein